MSRKAGTVLLVVLLSLALLVQPLAVGSAADPNIGETPRTLVLLAGKTTPIGSLSVTSDGTSLVITYQVTAPGWTLAATHLYVSQALPAKTAPGSFPYAHLALGGQTDSYSIALADLGLSAGQSFYLAAQADVIDQAGEQEGAWASGPCLLSEVAKGGGWGMYARATLPLPVVTQGCTPGYWKNHTASWPPTGYSPSQSVLSAFSAASAYPSLASATLYQSLAFTGGSGTQGAAEILLRAATAALLNASHPDVAYPRLPSEVVAQTNLALASASRDAMLALAAALDADNNLGCPLH